MIQYNSICDSFVSFTSPGSSWFSGSPHIFLIMILIVASNDLAFSPLSNGGLCSTIAHRSSTTYWHASHFTSTTTLRSASWWAFWAARRTDPTADCWKHAMSCWKCGGGERGTRPLEASRAVAQAGLAVHWLYSAGQARESSSAVGVATACSAMLGVESGARRRSRPTPPSSRRAMPSLPAARAAPRCRGWIWGCRLSALDLHRIYCSSLRLSDVDGGEAAGLPYALLLVFLRGNADLAGLARASE